MKTLKQNALPSMEMFDEGPAVMFDHTDVIDSGLSGENAIADKELAEVGDVLEGAETDMTSLESLLAAIDDAREVGLESWSAYFARGQVDSINKRYGFDQFETPMPAMESFNGGQKRIATSVSMESVKETIAKIWAWFKERLEKVFEFLVHYWNRLVRSLDYVQKEAEAVRTLANRQTWPGGKDIQLPQTIANRLAQGRVVPQQASGLLAQLHHIQDLNKVSEDTLGLVHKRIIGQFEAGLKGSAMPYKAEALIPQGWNEIRHTEEDARTFVSPTLPGNVEVRITVYGDANQVDPSGKDGVLKVRAKPRLVKLDQGTVSADTRALSSSEVISLCNGIIDIVKGMKENRRRIEMHLRNVKGDIDRLGNRYKPLNTSDSATALIQLSIRETMKTVYSLSVVYGTQLSRTCEEAAFAALTAYLSYAKHSARAYASAEDDVSLGRYALPAPTA